MAPTRDTGLIVRGEPANESGPMVFAMGAIYLALLITLGVLTFRKGHLVMFIVGFFLPVFWLIGALMRPRLGTR